MGEETMNLTKTQMDPVEPLFEDDHTDNAVAEQIGVDVRTLRRWQELPAFTTELERLHNEYISRIRQRGICTRYKRIEAMMDRHRTLNRLIQARAGGADPSVPGDSTGLIIKRIVKTKSGVYIEARVDIVTLRELDRLENSIARELDDDVPNVVLGAKKLRQLLADTDVTTEISSNLVASDQTCQPKNELRYPNRAARRQAMRNMTKSGQKRPLKLAV